MDKLLPKLDMGGNCSKQFYCLDGVESEDGEEEGVGTDKVLSKLVKGGKRMEQIKVKYFLNLNHYRRDPLLFESLSQAICIFSLRPTHGPNIYKDNKS